MVEVITQLTHRISGAGGALCLNLEKIFYFLQRHSDFGVSVGSMSSVDLTSAFSSTSVAAVFELPPGEHLPDIHVFTPIAGRIHSWRAK